MTLVAIEMLDPMLDALRSVRESVTSNTDLVLYASPALWIAVWIRRLHISSGLYTRSASLAFGVFLHELLHLVVGMALHGKPLSMSLWPRKIRDNYYQLGYVEFRNIRWYNAVFVGLAPLLGFVALAAFIYWRTIDGWAFRWWDVFAWLVMAQVSLSSWPSRGDLCTALRSWPIFIIVAIYSVI